MTAIDVYNPQPYPVVYGDGKTIGGLEWVTVDSEDVQEFIDTKRLITTKPKIHDPIPDEELVDSLEESSIDDSYVQEIDVSSDEVSQNEAVNDEVDDAPSDATETEEETATIRKSRRRKRTTTERE